MSIMRTQVDRALLLPRLLGARLRLGRPARIDRLRSMSDADFAAAAFAGAAGNLALAAQFLAPPERRFVRSCFLCLRVLDACADLFAPEASAMDAIQRYRDALRRNPSTERERSGSAAVPSPSREIDPIGAHLRRGDVIPPEIDPIGALLRRGDVIRPEIDPIGALLLQRVDVIRREIGTLPEARQKQARSLVEEVSAAMIAALGARARGEPQNLETHAVSVLGPVVREALAAVGPSHTRDQSRAIAAVLQVLRDVRDRGEVEVLMHLAVAVPIAICALRRAESAPARNRAALTAVALPAARSLLELGRGRIPWHLGHTIICSLAAASNRGRFRSLYRGLTGPVFETILGSLAQKTGATTAVIRSGLLEMFIYELACAGGADNFAFAGFAAAIALGLLNGFGEGSQGVWKTPNNICLWIPDFLILAAADRLSGLRFGGRLVHDFAVALGRAVLAVNDRDPAPAAAIAELVLRNSRGFQELSGVEQLRATSAVRDVSTLLATAGAGTFWEVRAVRKALKKELAGFKRADAAEGSKLAAVLASIQESALGAIAGKALDPSIAR